MTMKLSKGTAGVMNQRIREMLGGTVMKVYLGLSITVYVITLLSYVLAGSEGNLLMMLFTTLTQGFVAAECIILYQRKESRNFRHLSAYCLLGAAVMVILFLFLLATVIALITGYASGDEVMLEMWVEEDMAHNLPGMILTVVQTLLTAVTLLIFRFALKLAADWSDRQKTGRNWFRPAAILQMLCAVMTVAASVLAMSSYVELGVQLITVARDVCLGVLLYQAGREYGLQQSAF